MKKINTKYIFLISLILLAGLIAYLIITKKSAVSPNTSQIIPTVNKSDNPPANPPPANNPETITEPISNALARITKKPFGIKISPTDSPVSPERFSGYHTGVDFETYPDEQDIAVPIYAICTGPLVLKKSANGYGGMTVQQCQINKEDVTVIYGHLKLTSINAGIGQSLKAGEQLGILGKGYSSETDGERKHLHLGIHRGKTIDLRGYVQTSTELNQWLDFQSMAEGKP